MDYFVTFVVVTIWLAVMTDCWWPFVPFISLIDWIVKMLDRLSAYMDSLAQRSRRSDS